MGFQEIVDDKGEDLVLLVEGNQGLRIFIYQVGQQSLQGFDL